MMATTIAGTMHAVGVTPKKPNSARQVELPKPSASAGLALMRVLEVGIDGTDTEINERLYGEPPPGSDVLVIGHEAPSLGGADGDGVARAHPAGLRVATARRPARRT